MEGKDGDCNWCSVFNSDLPCMHLDPGVNRLGLNVTSIHQTDRRPVTPDIVFPICVILWPWEEGLKKKKPQQNNNKKRGQYISQIHSKIREMLLDCCLRERSRWLRTSKPKACKSKREERFQGSRTPLGGTEGRGGTWLRSNAGRPPTPCGVYLSISKSNGVILQTRWTCFLKGKNNWFGLTGLLCARHQKHPAQIKVVSRS